jgi:hypothetical protein
MHAVPRLKIEISYKVLLKNMHYEYFINPEEIETVTEKPEQTVTKSGVLNNTELSYPSQYSL